MLHLLQQIRQQTRRPTNHHQQTPQMQLIPIIVQYLIKQLQIIHQQIRAPLIQQQTKIHHHLQIHLTLQILPLTAQ